MVRGGFYKFGVDFVLDVIHLRGGLRGGLLFLIYDVLASKRVKGWFLKSFFLIFNFKYSNINFFTRFFFYATHIFIAHSYFIF
jgi:hypothetical protein